MKVAALSSVISGAVVAAALSSAAVQVQPTSVLVARPAPARPAPARAAPSSALPVTAASRPVAAAPARPAYVDLPERTATVSLTRAEARSADTPKVDVLACSRAWSPTGACPGTQTEVLRDAALDVVQQAVRLPQGAHVRVTTSSGSVQVEATRPTGPAVVVELPRLP